MKQFRNGQRVVVNACDYIHTKLDPPALGTVVRLRNQDNGAWVRLDERRAEDVHPFPAADESGRGCHVLAWPETCEAAK